MEDIYLEFKNFLENNDIEVIYIEEPRKCINGINYNVTSFKLSYDNWKEEILLGLKGIDKIYLYQVVLEKIGLETYVKPRFFFENK